MDSADIAREASLPTHYALLFRSGRNSFEYGGGFPFKDCGVPAVHMQEPPADSGYQAGVAFRLANGQLVVARPRAPTLRLARAA